MAVAFKNTVTNNNASAASTTVGFSTPATPTAGDIWICTAIFHAGSTITISGVPAGFNLISRVDSGAGTSNITTVSYWYKALGTETGTFATITISGSSKYVTFTDAFSGCDLVNPVKAGTLNTAFSASTSIAVVIANFNTGEAAYCVDGFGGVSLLENMSAQSGTAPTPANGFDATGGSAATQVTATSGYSTDTTASGAFWTMGGSPTSCAILSFILSPPATVSSSPAVKSLLIKLNRFKPRLLHNSVLNPDDSVRVSYVESATITSITSLSSTEIANYVDSATIASTTSISAVESVDYVEPSTVIESTTTLSAVESVDYVDSSTITSITTISVQVETYPTPPASIQPILPFLHFRRGQQTLIPVLPGAFIAAAAANVYTDSATITSITSISVVETVDFVESATVASTTSLAASAETAQYVDSATVSSATTLSVVESVDFVDSSIISSTTTLTSADVAAYVDSSTIISVTALSAVESADYVDSSTITSITSLTAIEVYQPATAVPRALLIRLADKLGILHNNILNPDDSVRVNYVESATITSVTSVSATETVDYVDSSTITSTTAPSSSDVAAYVDSSTVSGITTPSAIESTDYVEPSTTISTTTSLTSIETTQYVDSSTTTSTTSITVVETVDFVDSSTITSTTTVSATELYTPAVGITSAFPLLIRLAKFHGKLRLTIPKVVPGDSVRVSYIDSSVISSTTDVSQSTELANYVDSSTISGTTTPSVVESVDFVDSSTITGKTTPSSTEIAQYVENATIQSITSLTAVETTNYVDGTTVSSATSLATTESTDYVDSQVISSTTSISSIEIYTTTYTLPQPLLIKWLKRRLHNAILTPSGPASFQYVDSSTITSNTSVNATETTDYVDSSSIAGTTTPSSIEVISDIDATTINSTTSITSPADVVAFVDFATVLSITTPVGIVESYAGADSNTISGITSITYTEFANYVENAFASSTTIPSSTETAAYVDSASITSITYVTSQEQYIQGLTFVVDFVGVAFRRWGSIDVNRRWGSTMQTTRWIGISRLNHYIGTAVKRWTI